MLSTVCVHRYVTNSVPHGQHYAGPFSLVSGHFRQHEGERERDAGGSLTQDLHGAASGSTAPEGPTHTNTQKRRTGDRNVLHQNLRVASSAAAAAATPPTTTPWPRVAIGSGSRHLKKNKRRKKEKGIEGPQLPPHHHPQPSASGTPRVCLWWPTLAKHKAHRENKHLLAIDTTKMDDVIARELTSAQISDGKTELFGRS